MAKYLQLYLDTDYIIPVGVGDSGSVNKYVDQHASRRIWLYFSYSMSDGMYSASERNRANADAGKDGYYGDFWSHIAKGDKVAGESYEYIELLDLAGVISSLRDWSNATLFTETPEIVLHFSTVIPLKARRAFANYIESKLGKVRSYSKEINDLLVSKVLFDCHTMSPSFGDQIMIIQAAGRDILLSVQTWCGGLFMQGDDSVRLEKKGSEFLKKELVKMVVDLYERNNNMLLPTQREAEYSYQMQFADKWIQGRSGDNDFWVEDFHYSSNPAKVYPAILVNGKQLNLIERDAIRNTISDISKFYRENIKNRHLHTILLGDVFREEVFLNNCVSVTSSDGKYTYFNDNAVQEALGRYSVRYSSLEEDLRLLESTYMDKANERARIRSYVHNAEVLGALRVSLEKTNNEIRTLISDVKSRNENLEKSWLVLMRKSKFKEASETINKISASENLVSAKGSAISVLKSVERNNSLLIELEQLQDVKSIVMQVRDGEKKLQNAVSQIDVLSELPDTLKRKVQKYSDAYDRYKELRELFDNEPTLISRRNIVEQMKELTMEDLPVIDIQPIKGRITIKSTSMGGFWGIGSKKTLSIKLYIDNPLPCRGVLIISPRAISKIPDGRYGIYSIDVDKGKCGEVMDITEDLQSIGIDKKSETIFVKFWPHEDEKVPINRFEVNGGGVLTI